jgi:hypothetical protein
MGSVKTVDTRNAEAVGGLGEGYLIDNACEVWYKTRVKEHLHHYPPGALLPVIYGFAKSSPRKGEPLVGRGKEVKRNRFS